jgi:hypothetical protein
MKYLFGYIKPLTVFWYFALLALNYGCSGHDSFSEKNFTGKWQSSKLETPIHLYNNGEWEIKTDNGAILQYGIWEYRDDNIIWSYRSGAYIFHDENSVLSVTPLEFRLKESNKSISIFTKLD